MKSLQDSAAHRHAERRDPRHSESAGRQEDREGTLAGEIQAVVQVARCLFLGLPDRAQKLSGEEILHIARRGREAGCYLITAFINSDTGFAPPVPVDPADEKAELQRQFIERADALLAMGRKITAR
jgi:hypothetical protein